MRGIALLLAFALALVHGEVDYLGSGGGEEGACAADAHDQAQHWILRFHSYEHAEQLRARVEHGLQGMEGWQWIPRKNMAASLPTDFALLAISPAQHAAVATQLLQLPHARDLHPDRQLKGSLKWEPEGPVAEAMRGEGGTASGAKAGQAHEAGQGSGEGSMQQEGSESEEFDVSVSKKPGRWTTPFFPEAEDAEGEDDDGCEELQLNATTHGSGCGSRTAGQRRKLLGRTSVTTMLNAPRIWELGYSGRGVKVGVFDTGIRAGHPHVRNIMMRSDWTHQKAFSDGLGHGSFVAGVISSNNRDCPGFAPDVELHTFKVFTDDQVSYTSWFLDAFNFAIYSRVNIINLSIGGPDFLDRPFVDKIWEVTSSGIMMVSAIGNDGPLFGTLNNPADQSDVIGVGGIDDYGNIASFSSRGMTTWELPTGFGRVKPDIMAYARDVVGSKMQSGCRSLSGTSVASPVAAGAVSLLASTVPESRRWRILNPASMKQALVEGAERLPKLSMYEQGAGKLDLLKSMKILTDYQLRASVVPASIDFEVCPYTWPYCLQPLYAGGMPLVLNATVLNALGVSGRFAGKPTFTPTNDAAKHLHFEFEHSEILWPWSGYLALFIHVKPSGSEVSESAMGEVSFTITSPPGPDEDAPRTSTVTMPIKARIEPTPPRSKRILWDQFHSLKYPPGYVPRDNLDVKSDVLDWHGDHLYTNYHKLLNYLKGQKYSVEVLSSPLTCFDASQYGALLIVDPEEEFYPEEVAKIKEDVEQKGLNLIVFGEWYNLDAIQRMRFFDDNTRSWWTPITGGANVPALNDLLQPFGMAFGDASLVGTLSVAGTRAQLSHGADVARMPKGSFLHTMSINNMIKKPPEGKHGVLGVAPVGENKGHVVLYGDSNCLDSSHSRSQCFDFLVRIIERVAEGRANGIAPDSTRLTSDYVRPSFVAPQRRANLNFAEYSWVLSHPLKCYANAPCAFQVLGSCGGLWPPIHRDWGPAVAALKASMSGQQQGNVVGGDTGQTGSGGAHKGGVGGGGSNSGGGGAQTGAGQGGVGNTGGDTGGNGGGTGGSNGGWPNGGEQGQTQRGGGGTYVQGLRNAAMGGAGAGSLSMGALTACVAVFCIAGLGVVVFMYRRNARPRTPRVVRVPLA